MALPDQSACEHNCIPARSGWGRAGWRCVRCHQWFWRDPTPDPQATVAAAIGAAFARGSIKPTLQPPWPPDLVAVLHWIEMQLDHVRTIYGIRRALTSEEVQQLYRVEAQLREVTRAVMVRQDPE